MNSRHNGNWRVKSDESIGQPAQQQNGRSTFASTQQKHPGSSMPYQQKVPNNHNSWVSNDQRKQFSREEHANRYARNNNWELQGPVDKRIEAELFSSANSGINFDKYEGIPVEASGQNVPPPITHV